VRGGASAEQCSDWFLFLLGLRQLMPRPALGQAPPLNISLKPKRRKRDQLEMSCRCELFFNPRLIPAFQVDGCLARYSTEGSLKRHMLQRRPTVPYRPPHLRDHPVPSLVTYKFLHFSS